MISPEQRKNGRGISAFTMIEMVAVIAIVAILMMAGASLISGTAAQARKAGTDTLTGMIEQARAAAITSRCYVVLAIAEPGDLPGGDERCRLGLFKIEADKWPAKSSEPITAVMLSRWRAMENGIALIGESVDGVANPLDADQFAIGYGTKKQQTVEVHAIAFNPRGGLHYPAGSTPVAFRLAEGNYQNHKPVPFRRGDSGTVAENRVKIGRVIARPYRIDG